MIVFSVDLGRKRALLSTKKHCLKDTDLYIDDDRTPKQQDEFRTMMNERWKIRQKAKGPASPDK